MNSTHHYFLTAAIAFVLTVSSTSAQQPAIAPQVRRLSIPAGSPVSVRLTSSISSNRLVPGATFEASLDVPLEVNGIVIAEPGARVDGRITESDATRTAATKATGQSLLAFQLTRIVTADGKTLDIQTNTMAKASGGASRRKDALNLATSVGLGMAFGGLAGGSPVGMVWRGRTRLQSRVEPGSSSTCLHP